MAQPQRSLDYRLAAVWFADIVGYSSLTSEDERHAFRLVRIFQAVARAAAHYYGGRIVKFIGDEALGEFPSTAAAVQAACALKRTFVETAEREGFGEQSLRIGIHVGDVRSTPDGDVYGDGINVAARIRAEAEPGQVLSSQDVLQQLRTRKEFQFKELGLRELKGIAVAINICEAAVDVEPLAEIPEIEPEGTLARAIFRLRQRPLLMAASIVGLLGLVGLGGYFAITGIGADPAGGGFDPDRLAVLYLDVVGDTTDLGPVADGLTEALIEELQAVEALDVISAAGVAPYRRTEIPVDSIGRVLQAGTILQGSLARSGDLLRLSIQLLDGASGREVLRHTLDRPREEVVTLQEDLVREVGTLLRKRLGESVRLREMQAGTENARAWELVQQAEGLLAEAKPVIEAGDLRSASRLYDRADSLLAEAQGLDKRWVEPPILRARLDFQRSRWPGLDVGEIAAVIEDGLQHVEEALLLDPDHPDALELRGVLRYWSYLVLEPDPDKASRLLEQAETDLRAATERNPRQAMAWYYLAHLLGGQNENAQAKLAARRAYEADAYLENAERVIWQLVLTSYDLQEHTDAEHWCRIGQERFPEDRRFVLCELFVLTMEQEEPDVERAWELVAGYERMSPPQEAEYSRKWAQMLAAAVIARAEMPDSARAVASRAHARESLDPTRELLYLEAFVYTLLDEKEKAIDLLATYFAANPGERAALIEAENWWFEPLKDDARYQMLLTEN